MADAHGTTSARSETSFGKDFCVALSRDASRPMSPKASCLAPPRYTLLAGTRYQDLLKIGFGSGGEHIEMGLGGRAVSALGDAFFVCSG